MMLTHRIAGDIFIWDRESAALLHHVRPLGAGDLTCIAWNHAADSFMFATGSHDGAIRIWSTPPSEDPGLSEPPSRNSLNTNTPRTTSPSLYDADYRTDSPSGGGTDTPGEDPGLQASQTDFFSRDRSVTFSSGSQPK